MTALAAKVDAHQEVVLAYHAYMQALEKSDDWRVKALAAEVRSQIKHLAA